MQLGFNRQFLWDGKPANNDEIRIHTPVPVAVGWQTCE
jgi:hypothetical protein